MSHSESNRREFLRGEGARRAIEQVLFDSSGEPLPLDSLQAVSPTLEFHADAMACRFAVFLNRADAAGCAEAAIDSLALVAELEAQLTVYRESSEVSTINRCAADGPVKIESRLFDLLLHATAISAATGGAFDITSGPLSKCWGFYRREGKIPTDKALREALDRVGYSKLKFDEAARTIRFDGPGVELNLGGVGKGYALDRVAAALRDRGVDDFLIHGGSSSVRACGRRGDVESGWPLALRHPIRPRECLGVLSLQDRSLGTSGSGNQFFRHQGKRLGHILDPRTGRPVDEVWSATVTTPLAMDADALATAFFVMGVDAAEKYCETRTDVAAIFVLPDEEGRSRVRSIGKIELEPLS